MSDNLFSSTALDKALEESKQNNLNDDDAFRDLQRMEKEESLRGRTQDREQRKEFSKKIYRLTIGWLIVVGFILLLQGFSAYFWVARLKPFHLSDGVIIALITGTSINIIGLMAIVIHYLFPNGKAK